MSGTDKSTEATDPEEDHKRHLKVVREIMAQQPNAHQLDNETTPWLYISFLGLSDSTAITTPTLERLSLRPTCEDFFQHFYYVIQRDTQYRQSDQYCKH